MLGDNERKFINVKASLSSKLNVCLNVVTKQCIRSLCHLHIFKLDVRVQNEVVNAYLIAACTLLIVFAIGRSNKGMTQFCSRSESGVSLVQCSVASNEIELEIYSPVISDVVLDVLFPLFE